MDRQGHDYGAMPFAQQQQQFGFHPQPQQYPQVPGSTFLPPHPSMQQQYGFPRHLPPPQQQLHPHAAVPLHPHPLLHLQQQQTLPAYPTHALPHPMPSPFASSFDQGPTPAAPPSDPELHKRIDKLVEYAVKNGPEFEAMIREKQQDNPAYGFLFGSEGHAYYRYKLWISTRASSPFNPPFQPLSLPTMHPTPYGLNSGSLTPPLTAPGGLPSVSPAQFPSFQDPQLHSRPLVGTVRTDYDYASKTFKGLSGPLPSDVAAELNNVLNNLNGTKESIKGAKSWFMQRSPFAPALAEALRDRVFSLDDSERQLHIIYLANDILFESLQRRAIPRDLDNEAFAFRPVLGSMLARIYHNPQNQDANQSRLRKILEFWASKEVYDTDTIKFLEGEMVAGLFSQHLPGPSRETVVSCLSEPSGQWNSDKPRALIPGPLEREHQDIQAGSSASLPCVPVPFPTVTQPFGSNQPQIIVSQTIAAPFVASVPSSAPVQLPSQLLPVSVPAIAEKLTPYPLFPPGLIPGMVRKMQIGSGVPYSPMSPLDIPTMIPPSTISEADILDRVTKFFKEIGEQNPSDEPMRSGDAIYKDEDRERELPVRKGGACIPPPPNLQVDPETGTLPDGSVEHKPGSISSGRLGLGANIDPNEASQYDDVYNSYRKQRSTSYHSSMSARATAR